MTDQVEENDPEVKPDDDRDEEVDRAPQPSITPAPGEPPLDSGAITGGWPTTTR